MEELERHLDYFNWAWSNVTRDHAHQQIAVYAAVVASLARP